MGKRLIDILASAFCLIFFSWLLLSIALCVKLASPGPVIFRQIRIGLDGRDFTIFKFRSMPVNTGDVPSDQLVEVKVNSVGRFIRRTNLDELPQLFNILIGDMSVVGPRPALPQQAELVSLRRSSGSLTCRPGLTGLAQVNSFNGMSVQEKAEFDLQYARQISFFGDLAIIAQTFQYLLKPPPTY